jgi:hypothetical protein
MDTQSQAVHDAIKLALKSHRLFYRDDEDGGGLSLADALTPDGYWTVKPGLEEIDLIADSVWYALQPVLGMPNPSIDQIVE